MIRKELVDEIQARMPEGTTKVLTDEFLTAFIEVVEESVAKGIPVKLIGFGTWERKDIKGREGVSKLQGVEKAWKTEDSFGVKFKEGKEFVNKVNGLV